MIHQSDEDRRDIESAAHIRDFVDSQAYKILDPLLKLEVDRLRAVRGLSDDPNVVMSCVKKEDGIMLIYELIDDLISRGDDAVSRSSQ